MVVNNRYRGLFFEAFLSGRQNGDGYLLGVRDGIYRDGHLMLISCYLDGNINLLGVRYGIDRDADMLGVRDGLDRDADLLLIGHSLDRNVNLGFFGYRLNLNLSLFRYRLDGFRAFFRGVLNSGFSRFLPL